MGDNCEWNWFFISIIFVRFIKYYLAKIKIVILNFKLKY